MRQLTLARFESGDGGTFGTLEFDGKFFYTGELPWRNNERGKSCIPPGTYNVTWAPSPKFGAKYELQNVPGRSEILFHAGNWCGDKSLGLKSDVDGCILLGYGHGELKGQPAVTDSKRAVEDFEDALGKAPFELTITEVAKPLFKGGKIMPEPVRKPEEFVKRAATVSTTTAVGASFSGLGLFALYIQQWLEAGSAPVPSTEMIIVVLGWAVPAIHLVYKVGQAKLRAWAKSQGVEL